MENMDDIKKRYKHITIVSLCCLYFNIEEEMRKDNLLKINIEKEINKKFHINQIIQNLIRIRKQEKDSSSEEESSTSEEESSTSDDDADIKSSDIQLLSESD